MFFNGQKRGILISNSPFHPIHRYIYTLFILYSKQLKKKVAAIMQHVVKLHGSNLAICRCGIYRDMHGNVKG